MGGSRSESHIRKCPGVNTHKSSIFAVTGHNGLELRRASIFVKTIHKRNSFRNSKRFNRKISSLFKNYKLIKIAERCTHSSKGGEDFREILF